MTGDPFVRLEEAARERLKKAGPRKWTTPMLARLTDRRFSDPDWIFERKFDGERILAFRRGRSVRLLTRNRKNVSETYPELVDALSRQKAGDFIVDGEVVAFAGKVTSFARLQQRMQIDDPDEARKSRIAVYYYLFDILHLGGYRLDSLPLRARKMLLKNGLRFSGRLRFTRHRNRDGEAYFKQACEKGWEGVIAKRADSPYAHGRSGDWLKFKCAHGQELVIGGFTPPRGSRKGFGALLVGYYEKGELRYAGKVGTGFDDETLKSLRQRLDRLSRENCPFAGEIHEKGATWVTPRLVGEFAFTEWTKAGKLRHPRFLGLRRDKKAKDVVRERAKGKNG